MNKIKLNEMKNRIKNNKVTAHCPPLLSTQILLNNQVKVTDPCSRFFGRIGIVNAIMADGHSLDVNLNGVGDVFLDVTLVSEIQEPVAFAKGKDDLGSIANSVVQAHK
jgi:hypothetical protein